MMKKITLILIVLLPLWGLCQSTQPYRGRYPAEYKVVENYYKYFNEKNFAAMKKCMIGEPTIIQEAIDDAKKEREELTYTIEEVVDERGYYQHGVRNRQTSFLLNVIIKGEKINREVRLQRLFHLVYNQGAWKIWSIEEP